MAPKSQGSAAPRLRHAHGLKFFEGGARLRVTPPAQPEPHECWPRPRLRFPRNPRGAPRVDALCPPATSPGPAHTRPGAQPGGPAGDDRGVVPCARGVLGVGLACVTTDSAWRSCWSRRGPWGVDTSARIRQARPTSCRRVVDSAMDACEEMEEEGCMCAMFG